MEIDTLKKQATETMEKSILSFQEELKRVRTGRAHVSLLDGIMVNYYGNPSPLNQVASVSTPDARSFVISPWEQSILKDIEAAIVKSNIGMTPQNDGKMIRLKVPEVTEERRKELVKSVNKMSENAKIAIRQIRKNSNDSIKASQKNKEIGEDQEKVFLEEIQKITDDFVKKVDQITAEKEKDLLSV